MNHILSDTPHVEKFVQEAYKDQSENANFNESWFRETLFNAKFNDENNSFKYFQKLPEHLKISKKL